MADSGRNGSAGRSSLRGAPVAHEAVRITVGGVTLDGDLARSPHSGGIVLFAHGSGSSRHSPRNRRVAEHLQRAHLGTLLMDLLTADEEQLDLRSRELRFDIGLLARRLVGVSTGWPPASAESSGRGCSEPAPVRPPPWWPPPSGPTGWLRWCPAAAGRTWPARPWRACWRRPC